MTRSPLTSAAAWQALAEHAIALQDTSIRDLFDASADVGPLVDRLRSARHLYLVGCGTSYHAAAAGSVYLAQLAGRAAIPVLAPQFIAQYGPALGAATRRAGNVGAARLGAERYGVRTGRRCRRRPRRRVPPRPPYRRRRRARSSCCPS